MSENPATAEVSAKPPILPKLLIAGLVASVIVEETFIFFSMVPSADEVAALAEARLIRRVEQSMDKAGVVKIDDPDAIQEFALGTYGIVFTPPGADRNYRVEFRLFGTVKRKDQGELER